MTNLKRLRREAAALGVLIETQRDDFGWSYWLIDPKTREGVIDGDSFCTSHGEIEHKLDVVRAKKS